MIVRRGAGTPWRSGASQPITLPGDHYTIMQRPAVERLAEILAGEIDRHEQINGKDSTSMNLMRFLLRSSRSIVILSAIAGAAGGVTGIALIALIQRELAREPSDPGTLAWAFFALCVASASARAIAQIAMVKIGQGAIAELSLHLVRHILVLPVAGVRDDRQLGPAVGSDR